jgi:hypothetical protein
MVRHSADGQRFEFVHPRDSGHIRPQSLFQIERNGGPAVFGREHAVVETAAICVGHRLRIVVQHTPNKIKPLPHFLRFFSRPLKGTLPLFPFFSRR